MDAPITSFDDSTLRTLLATLDSLSSEGRLTPVITLDGLRSFLTADQQVIVDQIISLKPQDYGVDTPYAGELEPVPTDLECVTGQQYREDGETRILGDKYVPRHVFDAYTRMNETFMAEHPARRLPQLTSRASMDHRR